MTRDSSYILTCLGMSIDNWSMCRSYQRDISNIHPSEFYWDMNSPMSMSCHLRTLYRIAGAYTYLRYMGWDTMSTHPCRPTLSLKNSFKIKLLKTLVSPHSPTLWHTYVPQGISLRSQGWQRVKIMTPSSIFWDIFYLSKEDCDFHEQSYDFMEYPLGVRLTPNLVIFHPSNFRVACQNSYWNSEFWGYSPGPYSVVLELVFNTCVGLFSPTLLMSQLGFSIHFSWYVGWCIVLLSCIT